MNEVYKFYLGILLILIGGIYVFWSLSKKDIDSSDWLKKVDSVNSWVIAFVLISVGIILMF